MIFYIPMKNNTFFKISFYKTGFLTEGIFLRALTNCLPSDTSIFTQKKRIWFMGFILSWLNSVKLIVVLCNVQYIAMQEPINNLNVSSHNTRFIMIYTSRAWIKDDHDKYHYNISTYTLTLLYILTTSSSTAFFLKNVMPVDLPLLKLF